MVLLIYFVFILLVAFPLGEFTRLTPGLHISFTLLEVTVAIGSFIYLARQLLDRKKPGTLQSTSFFLVTGIFVLSLLVNSFYLSFQQTATASLYIVRWISLGSLFFMVKNSTSHIRQKLPIFLTIGGSLLLLGGYIQYFLYPSLRNLIYFGWDEHFYRMFGTFFDPNFFGLFLVIFFLFIVSQMFQQSPKKRTWTWAFYLVLAISIFVGIFLTYSRTALLALFCGVCIFLWDKYRTWILAFVAVCIACGILFFPFQKHRLGNNLFRTDSTGARLGNAKNAVAIFMDDPIVGIGFNAYRYAVYRHHFQPGSQTFEDHGASGADSSMLLVLATSGILGFSAFCLFLWSHVQVLVRKKNKLGLATLVSLFIGCLFINGLFYSFLLVWTWVVLGLTESGGQ